MIYHLIKDYDERMNFYKCRIEDKMHYCNGGHFDFVVKIDNIILDSNQNALLQMVDILIL